MPRRPAVGLTIGRLAKAAAAGVETVRYYQRRGLLTTPQSGGKGFRRYGTDVLERLQGIKCAQHAGLSLTEIAVLPQLDRVPDRHSAHRLAVRKLVDIDRQIEVLQAFRHPLGELVHACEGGSTALPCPIIDAFQAISGRPSGRLCSAATLISASTNCAAPRKSQDRPD